MSTPPSQPFVLSANFSAHESDVRCLTSLPDGRLISGSRDTTIKVWHYQPHSSTTTTTTSDSTGQQEDQSQFWSVQSTLRSHQSYVSSLTAVQINSDTYMLFSGGHDKQILGWELSQMLEQEIVDPQITHLGHTNPISCLASASFHSTYLLVSGSWDNTIRVWDSRDCLSTLNGHTAAVWSVVILPSTTSTTTTSSSSSSLLSSVQILSGSADLSVRLWSAKGDCLHVYEKLHQQPIRHLEFTPLSLILSCSNDCTIAVWSKTFEKYQELVGHDNFIYSFKTLNNYQNYQCASVSEDRSLKIWQGPTCIQTLTHPNTLWSVCTIQPVRGGQGEGSEDVVVGSADGSITIWTRNNQRETSKEKRELFSNLVSMTAIPSATVGGIKLEGLEGPEALENAGQRDGQTKIVRTANGKSAECYQWSATEQKWEKIGDVVDNPNSQSPSGSKTVNGKTYDYVFDVDLSESSAQALGPLRLGHNQGDNPYLSARRFIEENDLDPDFLEQITTFIVKNSAPVTFESEQASPFSDPFTGGNRYIPGQSPNTPPKPTSSTSTPTPKQQTQSSAGVASSSASLFPMQTSTFFEEEPKYEPFEKKVSEFLEKVYSNRQENESSEERYKRVNDALQKSLHILKQKARWHATEFQEKEIRLLVEEFENWPPENKFPLIDILRLVVLHPDGATKLSNTKRVDIIGAVIRSGLASQVLACQFLSIRLLVNLFKHLPTRQLIVQSYETVLDNLSRFSESKDKNIRVALSKLIYNFSCQFDINKKEAKAQCISLLSETLPHEAEPVALHWQICALANLIINDSECKSLAHDMELSSSTISNLSASAIGDTTKSARDELLRLLK